VVTEHQLAPLGGRPFEQLELGRHARYHDVHLVGARHLQTVGPVVVEGIGVEQGVQEVDHLVAGGHLPTVPAVFKKRP